MEAIEINFKYRGAMIDGKAYSEENCFGTAYFIELDSKYAFTLCINENEDWQIMRESDGIIPSVDIELLSNILKKLQWQLKYAA